MPIDPQSVDTTRTDSTTTDESPASPDHTAQDAASDPNAPDLDPTATDDENADEAGADDSDDLRTARREAANRRREVRDREQTITERDETIAEQAATIGTLQRQLVERIIASDESLPFMHRPADLFDVAGVDVADLTDDTGGIDTPRLTAALEQLRADRGYLFADRPDTGRGLLNFLMSRQGVLPGGAQPDTGAAWAGALKGVDLG